jgi:hypothetical protein
MYYNNGESCNDYDYDDESDDEICRHGNLLLWQWLIILMVQIPLMGLCLCFIYRMIQSSLDVLPSSISTGLTGDGTTVTEAECYDKDDNDQDDFDDMIRFDAINNANDEDYDDTIDDDNNNIDNVNDNVNDDLGFGFDLNQDLAHTLTLIIDAALDVALDVDEIYVLEEGAI